MGRLVLMTDIYWSHSLSARLLKEIIDVSMQSLSKGIVLAYFRDTYDWVVPRTTLFIVYLTCHQIIPWSLAVLVLFHLIKEERVSCNCCSRPILIEINMWILWIAATWCYVYLYSSILDVRCPTSVKISKCERTFNMSYRAVLTEVLTTKKYPHGVII